MRTISAILIGLLFFAGTAYAELVPGTYNITGGEWDQNFLATPVTSSFTMTGPEVDITLTGYQTSKAAIGPVNTSGDKSYVDMQAFYDTISTVTYGGTDYPFTSSSCRVLYTPTWFTATGVYDGMMGSLTASSIGTIMDETSTEYNVEFDLVFDECPGCFVLAGTMPTSQWGTIQSGTLKIIAITEFDGAWEGTTTGGESVSFQVTNNKVVSFDYTATYTCQVTGSTPFREQHRTPDAVITSAKFNFAEDVDTSLNVSDGVGSARIISGQFISSDEANGSLGSGISVFTGSGFGTQPCIYIDNWTATKN